MEQHAEYYDVELEQDSTNDALFKHDVRVHVCACSASLATTRLTPRRKKLFLYFHTVDHTNMLASSSDRLRLESRNRACGVGMPTMLRVVMCMCTHACTYMLSYLFFTGRSAAGKSRHTPEAASWRWRPIASASEDCGGPSLKHQSAAELLCPPLFQLAGRSAPALLQAAWIRQPGLPPGSENSTAIPRRGVCNEIPQNSVCTHQGGATPSLGFR